MRVLGKAFAATLALSAAAVPLTIGATAGPPRVPSRRGQRTLARPAYDLDWDATRDVGGSQAGWRVSRAPTLGPGGAPPPGTFPTLAAPALRDWIGHLPAGSHIYGLLTVGHAGRIMGHSDRRYMQKKVLPQMRDLGRFCRGRQILLSWSTVVD